MIGRAANTHPRVGRGGVTPHNRHGTSSPNIKGASLLLSLLPIALVLSGYVATYMENGGGNVPNLCMLHVHTISVMQGICNGVVFKKGGSKRFILQHKLSTTLPTFKSAPRYCSLSCIPVVHVKGQGQA